jgi:hypothetical protein
MAKKIYLCRRVTLHTSHFTLHKVTHPQLISQPTLPPHPHPNPHPIVPWCNGSTRDFGSLGPGSNPGGTTLNDKIRKLFRTFCFAILHFAFRLSLFAFRFSLFAFRFSTRHCERVKQSLHFEFLHSCILNSKLILFLFGFNNKKILSLFSGILFKLILFCVMNMIYDIGFRTFNC